MEFRIVNRNKHSQYGIVNASADGHVEKEEEVERFDDVPNALERRRMNRHRIDRPQSQQNEHSQNVNFLSQK